MKNFYEVIEENKLKSTLVVGGFVAFISIATYLISYAISGDSSALFFAMVISTITGVGGYYYSDKIILSMSNARIATKKEFFDYYTVTENLARVAHLPAPKLYVIDDTAMNAFATGRDPEHAVICVTTGLLSRLNRSEIEGVVGHEMSHIRHYDIRLMGVISVLVGSVTLLADWLLRFSFFNNKKRDEESGNMQYIMFFVGILFALLSPLIAQVIQLAISRRREFFADAGSVSLTKNPQGLIKALEKISADTEPLEAANKATAHLYISNPLKNRHDAVGWFSNLFRTHPPIKERIRALQGQ